MERAHDLLKRKKIKIQNKKSSVKNSILLDDNLNEKINESQYEGLILDGPRLSAK